MKRLPNPDHRHPVKLPDGSDFRPVVHLAKVISNPNIEIGAYTYYHDARPVEDYSSTIAPYLAPGREEKLRIGKFCQIAEGVQFITSSAKHAMDRISTYPFSMFDPDSQARHFEDIAPHNDTIVGNDCWIGREALLLPGTRLGDGVIVGARAVVSGQIGDYAIVVGNPGHVIRHRFAVEEISILQTLKWWDWPVDDIEVAMPLIEANDVAALAQFYNQRRSQTQDQDSGNEKT